MNPSSRVHVVSVKCTGCEINLAIVRNLNYLFNLCVLSETLKVNRQNTSDDFNFSRHHLWEMSL